MKKKLLTLFLSVMSALFVFGAKASASTISVVSDTAYAPFEFKDSDQTYKVSMLILSTKLPNVRIGMLTKLILVLMQPLTQFSQDKQTPSWQVQL